MKEAKLLIHHQNDLSFEVLYGVGGFYLCPLTHPSLSEYDPF